MKYLVKDMPIRKNNKTYGVGEEFPYSESDKSLREKGYLLESKETSTAKETETKNVPVKDTPQKQVSPKKKKTNSKK